MAKKLTDVDDIIKSLPEDRQKKIEAGAEELVALEMTLQELRKTRDFTQEELAEILELGQENVSRFESRSNVRLSSLQSYIRALGGTLKLIAEFPDSERVEISGFDNN
jgi:DNA-directed RNA polymerase specialized sigma subunit